MDDFLTQYEKQFITVNGLRLHVLLAGPEAGKLLIFLHGFPESSYGWRHQIDYFAKRGYRVLVPDQRAYHLSEKPLELSAYSLENLAKDVIALIDHFKRERAVVVGHDWGAVVAWWTANRFPQRLEKMVALNVPHHQVFKRFIARTWKQKRLSWYILLFQIPYLAEKIYFRLGLKSMVKSSLPGTFSPEDLEIYRKTWAREGALTGMMNWYRAAFRCPPQKLQDYRIQVPTLLLWGKKDAFLMHEMAQPSVDLCEKGRLVFLEEATHWLQHEFPEKVNELIREFIEE